MLQTKVVEKIKPRILCCHSPPPPPKKNRAIYEMWENAVEHGRQQMTKLRMRIACWITNVRDTHSEYVILIAFPQ